MSEYICLKSGDFLKNAGIVGFVYMLRSSDANEGTDFFIEDEEVSVNKEFLIRSDITKMYFDACIKKFGQETAFAQVMQQIEEIISRLYEIDGKKLKDTLKFISDKLTVSSLVSGYESIKDSLGDTSIYEQLKNKKINDALAPDELFVKMKELYEFLKRPEVSETFYFKNIAYNYINSFWEGICFLNRNNAKKNMKQLFKSDFEDLLKKYVTKENKKPDSTCIDCGGPISSGEKISIAFLKDVADDLSRKKSAFWNFKVDAYLCPVCAVVYASIPLGFVEIGGNFVFVNANDSIKSLIEMNKTKIEPESEPQQDYNKWINEIINEILKHSLKRLSNVQVITRSRHEQKYHFNIIGKDVLEILNNASVKKQLEKLAEKSTVKDGKEYLSVYDEAVRNILNYRNQYHVMNRLLVLSITNPWIDVFVYRLLLIQTCQNRYRKQNEGGYIMNSKSLYYVTKAGYQLRNLLLNVNEKKVKNDETGEETKDNDDTLRGTVYQLINALNVKNNYKFMDIVLRLYGSCREKVPEYFLNVLGSEEEFLDTGYAFVLGLKGGYYEKEEKEKVKEGEGEK